MQEPHPHAGLTDEQWKAFLPQFSGDVDKILSDALDVGTSEHAKIAGLSYRSGADIDIGRGQG